MTLITAHSGSDGTPENSLEFATFFIDKPVDVLEIDVRKNRVGQLVLSHDELTDRPYVSLETFLKFIKTTPLKLNCDLKEAGLETAVYELVRHYDKWPDTFLSGKVSPNYLNKWSSQLLMNIENTISFSGKQGADVSQAINELVEQGTKIINMPDLFFNDEIFRQGQKADLEFSLWTVNDLERMKELVGQHIFNITSRKAWEYLQKRSWQDEVFESETSLS